MKLRCSSVRCTSCRVVACLLCLVAASSLCAQTRSQEGNQNSETPALTSTTNAAVSPEAAAVFARLPIQHAGRIKPMATFARHELLTFSHRSKIGDQDAITWLANTLLDPEKAANEPIFRITNDQVLLALELEPNKKQLYPMSQLRAAIRAHMGTISTLLDKTRDERSLVEEQLVELYSKSLEFMALSRSLSAFIPSYAIHDPQLARALDLAPDQPASYYHFVTHRQAIAALLDKADSRADAPLPGDAELQRLLTQLNNRSRETSAQLLTILLPDEGEAWLAPWALLDGRPISPTQQARLDQLNNIVMALAGNDTQRLETLADSWTSSVLPDHHTIGLELIFDKADFFHKSVVFYIAAFLAFLIGMLGTSPWGRRIALGCLAIGIALHGTGLVFRMLIMGRPPVSNLYESIVFVGFIAAFFGFVIELIRKDSLGLLTACVLGTIFQFIGFRYASEGDTMGMLVAVLNSNFWLSTHVVTITIGYGASLVASLVGHVYLGRLAFAPSNTEKLNAVKRLAMGTTAIALLFTMIGTILGGIWADQSWGRFWGWDPKENGALLIVLWIVILLHARISGVVSRIGFAAALSLTSITVIIAWFGVNLLGVGLHSYGRAFGIGRNIAIFSAVELFIVGIGYFIAKAKDTQLKRAKEAQLETARRHNDPERRPAKPAHA